MIDAGRWLGALAVVAAGACGRGDAPVAREARRPSAAEQGRPPTAWPVPDNPGFTATSAAQHAALERQFLAVPSSSSVDARVKAWAAAPHVAGTPAMARFSGDLAESLRALGLEVTTDRYTAYLPQPRRVRVSVKGKRGWTLAAREPTRQPLAADARELLGWNQYSADGRASGPLIYAGFGTAADFALLAEREIDVRGKVLLVRYGKTYRGAKVRLAELAGARAVLLYSDPAEDGAARGKVVPAGPWRPASAIQHGTVVYQFLYPGDPLTPGRAATASARRLSPERALDLPRIPVATIAAADAEKLLRRMRGRAAGGGGFRSTYRHGPGPVVEVEVASDRAGREILDVVATIPGVLRSQIVLGNHVDAWIYGAVDPHSGTSALFEIARALAALREAGWTPRRTITLAFWDAEEPGVIGSTEWVEAHLSILRRQAVVYLNVDTLAAGALDVSGSPALVDVVAAAAGAVTDPVSGEPLAAAWLDRQRAAWAEAWRGRQAEAPAFSPALGDLGAGSDWTAFLHHAGIPSLQWTMNGLGTYAVYHSVLDDHDYARTWADPEFRHAPAFAQVLGLTALRLADADTLAFRYTRTADRLDAAVDSLVELSRAGGGVPRVALDPAPLRAAIVRLRRAAIAVENHQVAVLRAEDGDLGAIDRALPKVEQAFLDDTGLPGRPWYRHMLTAPSLESGFDPVVFPEAVEAVRAGDAARAEAAIRRSAAAIERGAAVLEAALGSRAMAARPADRSGR